MSKSSLEIACEKFFIKLFKADSRLTGKEFFHFDEEQKAKSNAIIVQAKQGNHALAGFGGYELELMVEYRTPGKMTKSQNDLIVSALYSIVYGTVTSTEARARGQMASNVGLSNLLIKDESTSDRQNSQDLRKRTLTFPLQAKLA